MNISEIQDGMKKCSHETERIYTKMGSSFPSLLTITNAGGSSSVSSLETLFSGLSEGLSGYTTNEVDFFEAYNKKNEELFTALNKKMAALDNINDRVAAIRTDSEELEIISLNAMVISIKSGEKGRAFSCITENLKRLSATMISLSNELILDEKKLLEKNEILKQAFSTVLSAQQQVFNTKTADTKTDILPILTEASRSLKQMTETAMEIVAPIHSAMAGIQLQDIIRQSIDQILLVIPEIRDYAVSDTQDEKLDQMTLDVELFDICIRIAGDVVANLKSSLDTFSHNWQKVHEILDTVEKQRLAFIGAYLDMTGSADKSLPTILAHMNSGSGEYISHINQYQHGQKNLVRDSSTIVSEVKHLRVVFDSIRPIIARLQHVRITQQIEVAKNPAIASVKDTVDHMSELIMQSDARVSETRKELEEFIKEIEALTSGYSSGADSDQRDLEHIKQEKTAFFSRMKEYHNELLSAVTNLRVYPDAFQSLCIEIDEMLTDLENILTSVTGTASSLEQKADECRVSRKKLLADSGLTDWQIHNDRLRDIAERFTITSHKKAAGEIGGFAVEGNESDSIESGDVTLFF